MLSVEGFRGVNQAEVSLAPITILTGRNNSGKSSLLEALAAAATAEAGLRDWLGVDVLRHVIDHKLMGHPGRLIREGAQSATIMLSYAPGPAIRIQLWRLRRRPRDAAMLLACRAVHSLSHVQLLFCMLHYAREKGREGEPAKFPENLTVSNMEKIVYGIERSMRQLCNTGRRFQAGRASPSGDMVEAAALALMDGLYAAARLVAEESIEARIEVGSELLVYTVYYPGPPYAQLLLQRLKGPLREAASDAAPILARTLGLEAAPPSHTRRLADCVANTLLRALERALRAARAPRRSARSPVLALFHRHLFGAHGGLVESLTDIVRRLHAAGALDRYRRLVGAIPGLGIGDPFIEEGEAWFRTSNGGRIPASLLGDGTLHLLLLLAGLAVAGLGGATVVYEEPETGLHPGYMYWFARVLVESVLEAGSQVAMSTHSLELIRYIIEAAEKAGATDQVAVVLMHDGDVYSTFQGSEAAEASELEIDLRGL